MSQSSRSPSPEPGLKKAVKKRIRSRRGCLTCRQRKVKCDERGRPFPDTSTWTGQLKPDEGCRKCQQTGRLCLGYDQISPIHRKPRTNKYSRPPRPPVVHTVEPRPETEPAPLPQPPQLPQTTTQIVYVYPSGAMTWQSAHPAVVSTDVPLIQPLTAFSARPPPFLVSDQSASPNPPPPPPPTRAISPMTETASDASSATESPVAVPARPPRVPPSPVAKKGPRARRSALTLPDNIDVHRDPAAIDKVRRRRLKARTATEKAAKKAATAETVEESSPAASSTLSLASLSVTDSPPVSTSAIDAPSVAPAFTQFPRRAPSDEQGLIAPPRSMPDLDATPQAGLQYEHLRRGSPVSDPQIFRTLAPRREGGVASASTSTEHFHPIYLAPEPSALPIEDRFQEFIPANGFACPSVPPFTPFEPSYFAPTSGVDEAALRALMAHRFAPEYQPAQGGQVNVVGSGAVVMPPQVPAWDGGAQGYVGGGQPMEAGMGYVVPTQGQVEAQWGPPEVYPVAQSLPQPAYPPTPHVSFADLQHPRPRYGARVFATATILENPDAAGPSYTQPFSYGPVVGYT